MAGPDVTQPTGPDEEEARVPETPALDFLDRIRSDLHPTSNTILIVDDDVHTRRLVQKLISKIAPDTTIVQAINGRDALAKLDDIRRKTKRDPLFIVTDLNMPVMDGWAFLEALRKQYKSEEEEQGIPVIVLSSTAGERRGIFFQKSIHNKKFYSPLVSIAKEDCLDPTKYTAMGEEGLVSWVDYFLGYS